MEDVNNLLENAVKSGQITEVEILKKIVVKLSSVKSNDGYVLTENDVSNWLSVFLPLAFNENDEIKAEVIRGLELLMPKLHKCPYQSFAVWSSIRKDIIETYTKHVREMFNNNSSEWHVIFNILLNILDVVISTSTAAINTFLPIIEMGFRSENLKTRAEAFVCWKELLKIFIKFDQISDPKRIKLICIPLKSSRSKTKEIAENKFDVWWTLIQALGDKLVEHTHLLQSFIYFCVGPFGKRNEPLGSYLEDEYLHLASPGKIFNTVRDFSIVAIAHMLGKPNRSVQRLAKQTKIVCNDNGPFCTDQIFEKIGITLIGACVETTVLISKLDANQIEINDCIWNSLLTFITDKNAIKYRRYILDSLVLYKKLVGKMSKEYVELLKQLIAGVITACVCHSPFVQDASTNEINEMVSLVNTFIEYFKPKQIGGMPVSIKARIKLEPKKSSPVVAKSSSPSNKRKKEEYVAIPHIWKFNPSKLTEHQRERMKERREDIPSLYDGNSQSSQDTEVKAWNPKQIVIAGDQSHDTMVLNETSNSATPVITRLSKRDSDENTTKPTGPSPRKALTRSSVSPKGEPSPKKIRTSDPSPKKEVADSSSSPKASSSSVVVKEEVDKSPVKTSPKSDTTTGAARRKAPPKSLKQRNIKELQNLAIDTVEGKKLMKEIQDKPDVPVTRRTSIDRGAKRVEPTWKQSLLPMKKTRKTARLLEKQEAKKNDLNKSPNKKVLTQKNDNKKQDIQQKPISEEKESQEKSDEEEEIPNSQEPSMGQMERRRSKRESLIITKSQPNEKSQQKQEKSEAERKAEVSRAISFDNIEPRSLRNSPRLESPTSTTTNQTQGTSQKTPEKRTETPTKTPEKLATTPTTRSSPRKPTLTETQHAAVPHPIIAATKSTSPTEASTASGTDVEMNELRRSPRKAVELMENETNKPAAAQMSPLKVSLHDMTEETNDRRKSPRKISNDIREIPTPSLEEMATGDHEYAKIQVTEEEEEVDYQIDEGSDENNEQEEESQVFMGEIIAPTSPTPNLDAELSPIDKSMTIPSSPDTSFSTEKTNEFLNNTLEISPITTGKSSPITRLAAKNAQSIDSPVITTTSPPEKKNTRSTATTVSGIVNLDSPKTSNVFQSGRSAHIMSMVFRQNSSTPNQQPSTSKSFSVGLLKNSQEPKDMFVFSKTLPGPDASPSASILKRKIDDSIDDTESPASKRKRVSFHDPPVSTMKEYIRHEEEIRSPSIRPPINRCLLMAAVAQQKLNAGSPGPGASPGNQFRYTLKRKGKRESTNDLRKLELSQKCGDTSLALPQITSNDGNNTGEMSTLLINNSTNNPSQMEMSEKDTSIRFSSKNEVLQYVMQTYQLEEILEMYFEEKKTSLNPKAVRIMARELSSQMETDSKLRYSILDRLSEKHASEFLEHAIQENPSKAICERLTLPVILNYITEKAGNDAAAKLQILKKFEGFIAGDEQTPSVLTKQELITFILNCLPEEMSTNETSLILDELFGDQAPAEVYNTLTSYFKKFLVDV